MEASGIQIEQGTVDGIPMLWAEGPEPYTGALVFRTGRADETLPTAGLSHLVEHLALFRAGMRRFPANGLVDTSRTIFWATGTKEEVTGFLGDVAAALGDLPLDRLEAEKRVLRTEEESSGGGGPAASLLGLRCGAAGYGLVDYRELGLHRLGPDEIAAWARERFTAGNAVVWMTCAPPDGFALPLRAGERLSPPPIDELPVVSFPAYVARGSGGVAVGYLTERSTPATIGLGIAAERMHESLRTEAGLSYSIQAAYWPLTADVAQAVLVADCLDEHAGSVRNGMLAVLESLAAEGPNPTELADALEGRRRAFADPQAVAGLLDGAADDVLHGKPPKTAAGLLREAEELRPEDVSTVMAAALENAILVAPTGLASPDGRWAAYELPAPPRPEGRSYRTKGKSRWSNAPVVVADEDALGLVARDAEDVVVPFESCVAVVRRSDGWISVLARDGSNVEFAPDGIQGGAELLTLVERRVPPELFLSMESNDPKSVVAHLAREKLGRRTAVWSEVERLPDTLEPGERVLTLAEVERTFERGLLAVTTKRVVYLSGGFTGRRHGVRSYPHEATTEVDGGSSSVALVTDAKRIQFGKLLPAGRGREVADLVRERLHGEAGID